MAIVLDTERFELGERADVTAAVLQDVSAPSYVELGVDSGSVRALFEAWQVGEVVVQQSIMSGFRVVRTPRQIRQSPSPVLTLNVQRRNTSHLAHAQTQYEIPPGEMFVMDFDLPYQFDWHGGELTTLFIPLDRLGLSTDTIRAALARPRGTPLYPVVANQICLMGDSGEALQNDAGARELGIACIEMVRGFLRSAAAHRDEDGMALPADILLTQIREYVRRRLSDPDLSAAVIARAHNISVRSLYKLCAGAGFGIEQWIIAQRLEKARAALVDPGERHRPIVVIAHQCGFRDASHFTRRFRAAFGMTPRDWRATVLEPTAGAVSSLLPGTR
ncbi:helix-turn-helix domain-containing protein [Nocardia sp. CDC159]|uniref:Helix-turn-helix domain-containing protein n=1 Tax=Nocardia pulmonis TaxID=2951408 RepID=A0A9X2IWV8_9NOCA|nr:MULTISPECIES: helix-turn-helix domain-containing protein [Nocardia]MCM6775357.1 helix-turn-helix domain-containing protein [Nocardia pulmonis]MCM6787909.1 helix-turn-helix domain-containing protein [Nocardia sp. CDC159]